MPRAFSSASIACGNPTALDPSFPLTVALMTLTSQGPALGANAKMLSRGLSTGLRGWSFGVINQGGTVKLLFTKYGVADIVGPTLSGVTARLLLGAVVTSTNVRFFQLALQSGTLTFANVANAQAFAAGAGNNFFIGCEKVNNVAAGRFYNGQIEVAAVWKAQATDTQVQDLAYGGLSAWYSIASPISLWQLDQQAITQNVVDEGGVANQSALVGTTVPATSYPEWCGGVGVQANG